MDAQLFPKELEKFRTLLFDFSFVCLRIVGLRTFQENTNWIQFYLFELEIEDH